MPLLFEIVVILGLSILVLLICHKANIPTVIGFLITGLVSGPHGLALIDGVHEVEILAEVGVVMLMFTIGLERSFKELYEMRRYLIVAGFTQVGVTTVISGLIALIFGMGFGEATFWGFFVALSSTAIVLKTLQDRAKLSTPVGRMILSILIFQDIVIVPMMLITPFLAGVGENMALDFLAILVKSCVILLLVDIMAERIVPRLLFSVVKTRSRELFLFTVFGICFGVAYVTNSVGLSLSLGAFLAGLIISESEYSHEALGKILPFQDIFTSFFFVSIGMLLNLNVAFEHPFAVVALLTGVIALKTVAGGLSAYALGFPLKACGIVGLSLSQIGEFSFVLGRAALAADLPSPEQYQTMLAVSIGTMAITPFLMSAAPAFGNLLLKLPIGDKLKTGVAHVDMVCDFSLKDHVVIIGYGFNGRTLATSCKRTKVPYIILDVNPEVVRAERENGEPIVFGDATQKEVLKTADIETARACAVLINDVPSACKIIQQATDLNPSIYTVVRTHKLCETEAVLGVGADHVVADEFESSMEIFSRILRRYLVPRSTIEELLKQLRQEGYEMLRPLGKRKLTLADLKSQMAEVQIETFRLPEDSFLVGKTVEECEIRRRYELTLLMIQRHEDTISNPSPDTVLEASDLLVLLGDKEHLNRLPELFATEPPIDADN